MQSWVQSWRPRSNAFWFFSTPFVYGAAPAAQKWCQVTRSAAPVTQNHLSKPDDLMLQNATSSGSQCPDLLTSLMNMSLVVRLQRKMHLSRSSSNVPRLRSFLEMLETFTFCALLARCRIIPCAGHAKRHLNFQKWSENVVFLKCCLGNVLRATTAWTVSTSQLPKMLRPWCVLHILTWKCVSRHNGVHLFDITTSKIALTLVCFVHFDLGMCFAPQQRALFRHLNFQKWSEHGVLCTSWLGNVLRATTVCNFSSLICPDGSAPASLASLLSTLRSHKSLEKHSVLSYLLAHLDLRSSDFLFFDLLSSALLFSGSCHLCFSICPYCRKFDF